MPHSPVVGYSLQNSVVSTHPQIERWHATGPTGDAEVFFFDKEKLNQLKSLPRWGPFGQFHAGESDGRAYLVVTDVLENNLINLKSDLTEGEIIGLLWHVAAALAEVHNNGNAHGLLSVKGIGLNEAGQLRILPDPEQLFFEDPDDQATAVAIDSVMMGKIFKALGLEGGQDPHKQLLLMGLNQDMARLRLQPAAAIRQAISALTSRNPDWEKKLIERLGDAFSFDRLPKPEEKPVPRKSTRPRRAKVNKNEIWDYTPYGERLSSELTEAESIGQSLLRQSFATDSDHSVELEDEQLHTESYVQKEEPSSVARIQIPIFKQEEDAVLPSGPAWNDLDSESDDGVAPARISIQPAAVALASTEPVAVAVQSDDSPDPVEAVEEEIFDSDPETSETAAWAASFAQAQLAEQMNQESEFQNYRQENIKNTDQSTQPDEDSVVFEQIDDLLENKIEANESAIEDTLDSVVLPESVQGSSISEDDGHSDISESDENILDLEIDEDTEKSIHSDTGSLEEHSLVSLEQYDNASEEVTSEEETPAFEADLRVDNERSDPTVQVNTSPDPTVESDQFSTVELDGAAASDAALLTELDSASEADSALVSGTIDAAASPDPAVESDQFSTVELDGATASDAALLAELDSALTSGTIDATASSDPTVEFDQFSTVELDGATASDAALLAELDSVVDLEPAIASELIDAVSAEPDAEEILSTAVELDGVNLGETPLSEVSDSADELDSSEATEQVMDLALDEVSVPVTEEVSLIVLDLEAILEAEVEFDSEDSSETYRELESEVAADSLNVMAVESQFEAEYESESEGVSESVLELDMEIDTTPSVSLESDVESDSITTGDFTDAVPSVVDIVSEDESGVSLQVDSSLTIESDLESDVEADSVPDHLASDVEVSVDSVPTLDLAVSADDLAVVGDDLAVVGDDLAVVGDDLAVVGDDLAVVGDDLAVSADSVSTVDSEGEILSTDASDPNIELDSFSGPESGLDLVSGSESDSTMEYQSQSEGLSEETSEEDLISEAIAKLEPDTSESTAQSSDNIYETIVPSLDSATGYEKSGPTPIDLLKSDPVTSRNRPTKERFDNPLRKSSNSTQPKWASLADNQAPGSSEDELGAGKWTESGRSVAEIEKTLPGTSVREFEIDQGGSAWGMFIIAIVVAVVLAVATWAISENEEADNLDSIAVPEDVMEAVPSVTRTVSVETTPDSGTVIFDDIQYGTAPISIPLPEDYDQEHTLCVQWGEDHRSCRQVKRGDFSSGVYKFEATR